MGQQMARHKIKILSLVAFAAVFFTGQAASLEFLVDIHGVTEHAIYDLHYHNRTDSYQTINLTLENPGSVGCTYRMAAEFESNGTREVAWSEPYALWPGDTSLAQVRYLPGSNGTVPFNLTLQYCGQQEQIETGEFHAEMPRENNETVESRTRSVNSSAATLTLEADSGVLIPEESPPGWKVSSARIEGSRTDVKYDAPIFSPATNLTYKVIDSEGEVLGETKVRLEPQPTAVEIIRENMLEIFLLLSVVLNIYLLIVAVSVPEKIKSLK